MGILVCLWERIKLSNVPMAENLCPLEPPIAELTACWARRCERTKEMGIVLYFARTVNTAIGVPRGELCDDMVCALRSASQVTSHACKRSCPLFLSTACLRLWHSIQ